MSQAVTAEAQAGPSGQEARGVAPALPRLSSQQLLQGARTVEILHEGAVYRLQATRLGKLILTK